jgi:hypothetical protein
MAKSKILCAHCDAKITKADSFCPNCKHPTMFATVEQRTAWELEQWTSKRTSPRKKVVGPSAAPAVKVKRAPNVEPPGLTPAFAAFAAARSLEPIKRVSTPRAIHPAVAARAARLAAAGSQASPAPSVSSPPVVPVEKDRVIVLPDGPVTKGPAAAAMKTPARAPKSMKPTEAAPKRRDAKDGEAKKDSALKKETAQKKEAARKKKVASAAPAARPKASRKAPKMAPMQIEDPVAKSNGHSNGNGHASNGNGHASNGNDSHSNATSEQTEILRELLLRVIAIEEKMTVGAPRARRFRLRKR